jgi:hypothetical protein
MGTEEGTVVDPTADNQPTGEDRETEEGDFLTGRTGNSKDRTALQDGTTSEGSPDTDEGDANKDVEPKQPYMRQTAKDLWNNESLAKFENVDKLARGYIDLEGKLSKAAIIPGKDASEDEWSEFLNTLGRPENSEGYEFETVEGLPPDISFNREKENDFRQTAHNLGLTKEQAKELHKWHINSVLNDYKGMVRAKADDYKSAVQAMKDEWGDEYGQNLELMRRGYDTLAAPELQALLKRTGLTNEPEIIKFFSRLGKLFAEDRTPTKELGGEPERDLAKILYPSDK